MLNCKNIVKIISSEDGHTWWRKFEVRLHLMMCRHCANYAKQIEILKSGVKKLFASKLTSATDKKIQEIENRIIDKVNK